MREADTANSFFFLAKTFYCHFPKKQTKKKTKEKHNSNHHQWDVWCLPEEIFESSSLAVGRLSILLERHRRTREASSSGKARSRQRFSVTRSA
jgi:hypothetical protein